MTVSLLDLILFVLFFQLLTLVPYLLTQKTNRGISNKLLAFFLLAKALCITNFLAHRLWNYTMEYFPHGFYIGSSFTVLWGPLLYLYVRSYTKPNFKLSAYDIIHIVPFILHITWFGINFHFNSPEFKRDIMNNGTLFNGEQWGTYHSLLYIYTLIYTVAALPLIKDYHNKVKENYSSLNSVNINWLTFVVAGFLLKILFDFWFQWAPWGSTSGTVALYSSRLTLFLFLNVMMFKGLKQPVIWQGETMVEKERKSALSKISQEKYLETILAYVEKHKPYLKPDITLEELARKIDIAPRSVSMVLNECLNQNFYDFINSYRIKESERLLREPDSQFKTVLEVLFEVGFNSKSSFNTAFKKFNGMTPTQYKKLKTAELN